MKIPNPAVIHLHENKNTGVIQNMNIPNPAVIPKTLKQKPNRNTKT